MVEGRDSDAGSARDDAPEGFGPHDSTAYGSMPPTSESDPWSPPDVAARAPGGEDPVPHPWSARGSREATRPLPGSDLPEGTGPWSEPGAAERTQVFGPGAGSSADPDRGPTFQPWSSTWSAPEETSVLTTSPHGPELLVAGAPRSRRRRGAGVGAAVGAAALTAALVGSAAGYGGFRLAERDTSAASAPLGTPYLAPRATPYLPPRATPLAPLPSAPVVANTVEIAKRVLPGTVMISVGSGTGSGFVLDDQGHIVTNNHVVAGASDGSRIRVTFSDGRRQSATLVGRSPSYDLAVIKVGASDQLQPLTVGDSDASQIGQPVIAVGSPLGLPGTVTQGIVSARNRPVVVNGGANADAPTAYINAIQTDAPINPGNSGGPLIDAGARVIGVNSAILTLGGSQTAQSGNIGLGFAIPANQVSVIVEELVTRGKATYPVIGATVSESDSGVRLTTVERGGPADDAGLRADDVVTAIDGAPVNTAEELIVAIRTRRPGGTVALDYSRGSNGQQARVTLGSKEG